MPRNCWRWTCRNSWQSLRRCSGFWYLWCLSTFLLRHWRMQRLRGSHWFWGNRNFQQTLDLFLLTVQFPYLTFFGLLPFLSPCTNSSAVALRRPNIVGSAGAWAHNLPWLWPLDHTQDVHHHGASLQSVVQQRSFDSIAKCRISWEKAAAVRAGLGSCTLIWTDTTQMEEVLADSSNHNPWTGEIN